MCTITTFQANRSIPIQDIQGRLFGRPFLKPEPEDERNIAFYYGKMLPSIAFRKPKKTLYYAIQYPFEFISGAMWGVRTGR